MAGVPQSAPPIWPLAGEDLAVFTLDRLFSDTCKISKIRTPKLLLCRLFSDTCKISKI